MVRKRAGLGSNAASNAISLNIRSGKLTMCSSIRVATSDDEPAAACLERRVFEDLRQIYKPKVSAAQATSPGIRVIAESADRRIIGTVRYEIDGDMIRLRGLAVEGRHRRAGIGRALVCHCRNVATSAGIDVLSLYTIKETGNVGFFERLGFQAVSEERAAWAIGPAGESVSEVRMELRV
jgi:N-acetylglutamate synthase-like GNAT family acetyltransferase